MIARVLSALRELNLLDDRTAVSYSVIFRRNLTLFVFPRGQKSFIRVKAVPMEKAERGYRAVQRAHAVFPSHVAEPLGFVRSEPYGLCVFRGLRAYHVAANRLLERGMRMQIVDVFERWGQLCPPDTDVTCQADIDAAFASVSALLPADVTMAIKAMASGEAAAMRRVPQHGDLTLCNLAIEGNRLVVFDWEDFGRIGVPGLDIWTLMIDLLGGFGPGPMEVVIKTDVYPDGWMDLLQDLCAAMGIEVETFFRLAPLYGLAFLHLKQHYGYDRKIVARVTDLVCELSRQPSALRRLA